MSENRFRADSSEIVFLAPRKNGNRNFVWLRGREKNRICAGGSSSVFRSALKAAILSMCTSSIMYILYGLWDGMYLTLSRSSLTWSTLLLEAPSISKTSAEWPAVISLQDRHWLHGTGVGPCSQFMALANTRATVVLPVPRGPENKIA